MIAFIDAHRHRVTTDGMVWGVEPICAQLQIAPSTYYAHATKAPSARQVRDARLSADIRRVHAEHYGVYGVRKVWLQLNREGIAVARCTVQRLMADLGLRGVRRGGWKTTTIPDPAAADRQDLVDRDFTAESPNELWVADLTYIRLITGAFVYAAFVIDVFSRAIVGWQVATTMHTDIAIDALDAAVARRADVAGVVVHTDRGSQYVAIRYTERLAEAGAVASVGSRGDSYDNALAETTIGLVKTELIHRHQWRSATDVEFALLTYVEWFNTRRLHHRLGGIPPAEFEAAYYADRGQLELALPN